MPGGFHPPPSVIATWPEPNYVDPEVRGKELIVLSGILGIASVLVVAARLYVRSKIQRRIGIDDCFLTLGSSQLPKPVFLYTLKLNFDGIGMFGIFLHMSILFGKCWIVQLLIAISTSFIKASVLLLYKRVIQHTANPKFMLIINLAIGLIFAYFVIFSLLAVLQCIPVESFWMQFSSEYHEDFHCLPESNAPVANAIFSIITDFVAALLPITLFTQIRLPKVQKISLYVLFGVGFILCILGIAKAVFLHRTFFESYDANWIAYSVWTLTVAENYVGIICSAIPPLRAPVIRYFGEATQSYDFQDCFGKKKKTNNTITTDSSVFTLEQVIVDSRQSSAGLGNDPAKVSRTLQTGDTDNHPGSPAPYQANITKPFPPVPLQSSGSRKSGTDTMV